MPLDLKPTLSFKVASIGERTMNRPYLICYMIMSLDGRIDCPMTEHLKGCDDYYPILDSLDAPTRISGRVTAELEMAKKGRFAPKGKKTIGKASFKKNQEAKGYDVICDTKGTLLWGNPTDPLLILTSEQASVEYLDYLDSLGISWIAAGKEHIDFKEAMRILKDGFGVERAAVVGGGHINAGFLKEGLLDEVVVLVGAGIDGRESQVSVFDGLEDNRRLTSLRLIEARALPSEGVLLRYKTV